MRGKWKKRVAKWLVFVMMMCMLPMPEARAEQSLEPLQKYTVEDVKNHGLPVIDLQMADENKYEDLKTKKEDKQNISKFTLYDTTGNIKNEVKYNGDEPYPLTAKGRGNSSWTMNTGKKPYNLKFEKKIDLLEMGKAKSWCLIANWVDTSYMRNYLAYQLACQMGMGTPDSRQVALCINGTFEGIYLLTEKVGLNEFRTEVPEADADGDQNGDGKITEVIIESDSRAYQNGEDGAFTTNGGVYFVPKDPEKKDMQATELTEIEKEVNAMEAAILSGENYKEYIDIDSWVDTYIINELAKNPDFGFGYQPCYSSSYLYFREGGKVYAGPVWDFDIAYGRNDYSKMPAEGNRKTADPKGLFTADTKYYKELLEKTDFQEYVIKRWKELKTNGTFETWLGSIYNDGYNAVKELTAKDLNAWGDKREAETFEVGRDAQAFEAECNYIRRFINDRIAWLDTVWNVDEIDSVYSGEWTREKVMNTAANPNYQDLINGNEILNPVWDGGYGYIEKENAIENVFGKAQGEIPGVPIEPITLKMDTSEIQDNQQRSTKWVSSTEGGGFGPGQESTAVRTITTSGRYIGIAAQTYWVNTGTYSMGQTAGDNFYRVYIVDVGKDGSITLHDGTVTVADDKWSVNVIDNEKHCGTLVKQSDNSYLLKYQQEGNGIYYIEGTGQNAVNMKMNVVSGGKTDLTVTERAEGTSYPDILQSFDATYLEVTDGVPEIWENSDPEIVAFDEVTKKVTALKEGIATITARAGTQSAAVTFTVTRNQASDLSKTEVNTKGIYAPELSRDPSPVKGTWATAEANQMYRFTYTFDISEEQFKSASTFRLVNDNRTEKLSGQGDYFVFVNGTPWLKADDQGTESNVSGNYSAYTVLAGNEASLEEANRTLKEKMQSGENKIDIFMISSADAYFDKPYLYGSHKIGGENVPPTPEVEVTAVTFDRSELTLNEKQTYQLAATVTPSNATNKTLTWGSSEPNIAVVDKNGKVTAKKAGTTVVTATAANGVQAELTVIVIKNPVTEEGFTMAITFATREGFLDEDSAGGETVQAGTALLDKEWNGLKDAEIYQQDNMLTKPVGAEKEESKANANSKKKGNANAEANSGKNGNNSGNSNKNPNGRKPEHNADKSEAAEEQQGILLWSGEAVAFAAKDFKAAKQIINVETAGNNNAELTFVTPGQEAQKLQINSNQMELPKIEAVENDYTYYLLANTGNSSVTIKNLWADQEIKWEVSYRTLPMMYEMSEKAFEQDSLRIVSAKFEQESVSLSQTADFEIKTTISSKITGLIVRDRFYGNGLYGELLKSGENILDNTVIWTGQVKPMNLTSTAYIFAAVDQDGNVSEIPVKLPLKVTRR